MSGSNESKKVEQQQVTNKQQSQSSTLPSSHGDSPKEMAPKDISPEHATWADRTERKITSSNPNEHQEALLDEAIEESFPASDPIAEHPEPPSSQRHSAAPSDEEEESLDDAIEMTFPASDPIAIPSSEELSHERDLRQGHTSHQGAPSR